MQVKRFTVLLLVAAMFILSVVGVQAADPIRLGSSYISLANVYQTDTGFEVWRWNPETEQGEHQFAVTYDEVEAAKSQAVATDEHIQLASSGDITMWALSSGDQCQVNSPTVDGTVYEFVFTC